MDAVNRHHLDVFYKIEDEELVVTLGKGRKGNIFTKQFVPQYERRRNPSDFWRMTISRPNATSPLMRRGYLPDCFDVKHSGYMCHILY